MEIAADACKVVGKPPIYKPTVEAYDQWAPVYDTDGNFLQALDSIMVRQMLLPLLTPLLPPRARIVDLGCGTGRTTLELLHLPDVRIVGLDNSRGMQAVAMARCNQTLETLAQEARAATLSFDTWDMLDEAHDVPEVAKNADAVVSTLVVEHIPLDVFFGACSRILKRAGLLLLTNMHPDMGAESQAGFTDPVSGEKVRPVSYAHTVEATVEEAKRWGFETVWGPEERDVREDDLEKLGGRAKKWVGKKVWFGMMMKKA
ncbi:MAG: hypothetical protein LQ345_001019 [Seirophora villosa]|nr:MAG: hypothetical protein LQ345_001019 [Seirophora villosa]